MFGSSLDPSFRKSASGASPNDPAPRSWLPGAERHTRTKNRSDDFGHLRNWESGVGFIYEQLPPRSESRRSRTGSLLLSPLFSCVRLGLRPPCLLSRLGSSPPSQVGLLTRPRSWSEGPNEFQSASARAGRWRSKNEAGFMDLLELESCRTGP